MKTFRLQEKNGKPRLVGQGKPEKGDLVGHSEALTTPELRDFMRKTFGLEISQQEAPYKSWPDSRVPWAIYWIE